MARIAVQREPFDTTAELAAVVGERRGVGAIVSFSGLCRDEGGALAGLEIERLGKELLGIVVSHGHGAMGQISC